MPYKRLLMSIYCDICIHTPAFVKHSGKKYLLSSPEVLLLSCLATSGAYILQSMGTLSCFLKL